MLNRKSSDKLKTNVFIFLTFILVFQNFFQQFISIFQYVDEIIAVWSFFVIIYDLYINNFRMSKDDLETILLLCILSIIGIISSIRFEYQTLKISFIQFLLFIKFYLVYLAFANLKIRNVSDKNKKKICKNIKFILLFLLFFTILNYVFKIWPAGYRHNIMVNNLFYSHSTYLVAVVVYLMCSLNIFSSKDKIEWKYIIISMLIVTSTLRVKGILFVALSIAILFYFMKNKKKLSIEKTIFLMIFLLIIGWNQFENYFLNDTQARNVLLNKSFIIAYDHFPFGTGFGTYGSFMSSENYSPLYYKYGLSNIYGLQPTYNKFICDSFWPMIISEFGYIGLMLYIRIIYLIYKKIQKNYSNLNYNIYINKMLVLFYLLISSSAEQAFVSPLAIPLAILLSI